MLKVNDPKCINENFLYKKFEITNFTQQLTKNKEDLNKISLPTMKERRN